MSFSKYSFLLVRSFLLIYFFFKQLARLNVLLLLLKWTVDDKAGYQLKVLLVVWITKRNISASLHSEIISMWVFNTTNVHNRQVYSCFQIWRRWWTNASVQLIRGLREGWKRSVLSGGASCRRTWQWNKIWTSSFDFSEPISIFLHTFQWCHY